MQIRPRIMSGSPFSCKQDKFKDLIFPENTRVDIYETGSSTYNFTAKEVTVESAEQLLDILADAERERKTSKTNMNAG